MLFTVIALVIISTSTKKNDEGNPTARVGGHIIENEEDLNNKEDIETTGKNEDEDHVFAISSATITF